MISRNSGEGKDRKAERGDYFLSDGELKNIRMMTEKYEKCIVLLNVGGIMDLSELKAMDGVHAIVLIGQTGNIGGYAVANVLTAKTFPSGKLTETVRYQRVQKELKDERQNEMLTLEDVKSGKATLEELTAQLTVEELADLCVGIERGAGEGNVIGSASACVPGAAGETSSQLTETRKIPNLILADGPAGLRLQKHFKVDKDGNRLPGGEQFGMDIAPFAEKMPKDAVDYYQFCTAIPIATTLVQSWDMELIQTMGQIVGDEMKRYHVHLCLAPGMNIHRNPLCGRNFEYYSEDPLLAGSCAAADTKGVQSHGGQGTTIKHFAGNSAINARKFTS